MRNNPMAFFSENVDSWGPLEWFDRLAKAVHARSQAVRDKDDIAFETYKNIASSSASRLVSDFEDKVRMALTTLRELEKANVAYVDANTALLRENERLRQFLFPYADDTEISGISWDGKYLIGDKASISAFREMENRGLQIDVYKRAYDEKEAALKAEVARLQAEIDRKSSMPGDHRYWEGRYRDEAAANEKLRLVLEPMAKIAGDVSESWPDDADVIAEIGHFRRARAALSSTGDTHGN